MSPEAVRARLRARSAAEVGPDVTVVAATKYVSLEDMAVLAEAGVEVVGENRAQDLERKHAEYGDAFRWHFIGHLQCRKAKVVNGICELVHSLASESAARRLDRPGARRGEPLRRGVEVGRRARAAARLLRAYRRARPDDDAAGAGPRGSRPVLPPPARAGRGARLRELSMGTSQDYRVAVEEGATLVRVGSVLFRG